MTNLRTTEAESMTRALNSLRQNRRHASITALKRHFIQNSFHFTRVVARISAGNGHPGLGSSGEPLQVVRVRGDGNCLFRSLAQSYMALTSGTLLNQVAETDMAKALRQQICDALVIQRDSVEPFLVDCDFDTYVSMMRRDGCWGGEPELSVAPTVLQRSIEVCVVYMHVQW